jgi:ABC-2 type transport system ATP-binding protein
MDEVLVCKNLMKRFGNRQAVDDISFAVNKGQCYGLLGPNGAGKTTTISIACGLLERDSGEVYVNGKVLVHTSTEEKKAIGYVPQDLALYPELSVSDNIRFFGRLYGIESKELSKRIDGVLELVGLSDRKNDRINTFSGGMKRRANIAVGLVHSPLLLVLDEPTVGVDPQSRNAILEAVQNLVTEGLAVLYTTHYMEEAERLCHSIGIMDSGKLIAEGTKHSLVGTVDSSRRIKIKFDKYEPNFETIFSKLSYVNKIEHKANEIEVILNNDSVQIADIFKEVPDIAPSIIAAEIVEPNLESVFLSLTGKELRD